MISLIALAALGGLQVGDSWVGQRTIRYLNVAEHIDFTDVDRFTFKVIEGDKIQVSRMFIETRLGDERIPATPQQKPLTKTVLWQEAKWSPFEEQIEERFARILFGLTAKRFSFQAVDRFLPAASLHKGSDRSGPESVSFAWAYRESGNVGADGTALASVKSGVLEELSIRLPNVVIPGGEIHVEAQVNFRITENRIKADAR